MKCKSCNQEGFKNPREIVVHKKNCSGFIVKETPMEEPHQTINPEVESKIENFWQEKMDNPTILKADPVIATVPIEVLEVSSNDNKEILMKVFNDLKTAEGKSVISVMLIQQKVTEMEPQEIFTYLFSKISDGDERAILRKFFI